MLQSTLFKLKTILKEGQLVSEDTLEKLVAILERFNKGDLLYPGVIIRKLGLSQKLAYDLLEKLKANNILQVNYELYCHSCNQFEGSIYETFNQLPDESYCEKCDTLLNPIDHSIVIYRFIE